MIKKMKNRNEWKLFTLTVMSFMFLVGCHTSKENYEMVADLPTPTANISKEPTQQILIVTGEYVPYVSQTLNNMGFFTELIEATLNNCDIEYKIEFYPWARCSEMVQSGEAWASFPYGHSELNDQAYLFSDPIFHTKHKFYYLKDNKRITEEALDYSQISDFSNFIFGGAYGYWYGNQEDFLNLGVTAEWASDTDALVKMLHSERIDFLIEDVIVGNQVIKRLFPGEEEKFATLAQVAKAQDYYLIVSKDYPKAQELLDQFNTSFQEVIDRGEFEQILTENGISY